LVHDVGELVVVLHHVFHHVRLVTFQRQTETIDLDDGIQQIEVVRAAVSQYPNQVDDILDLLRKYLQTRALVPDESLEEETEESVTQQRLQLWKYSSKQELPVEASSGYQLSDSKTMNISGYYTSEAFE